MHRTLEIETEPFLNPAHSATLGQVQEQDQIQNDRRGKNAVAAQEIDFDLHGITEPSIDIDVIPSFFIVAAGRIVMDSHLVGEILVKIRIQLRLENLIQNRQSALYFRFER